MHIMKNLLFDHFICYISLYYHLSTCNTAEMNGWKIKGVCDTSLDNNWTKPGMKGIMEKPWDVILLCILNVLPLQKYHNYEYEYQSSCPWESVLGDKRFLF